MKLVSLIALVSITRAAFTSSLADCQTFAALFDNTCNPANAAVAFASVPTASFTCN